MSRIPYITPETANSEQLAHLQNLQNTRGRVSNIFLALANVPSLGEGVLAIATSLRKSTLLSRRLRELAIVTVGIETNAYYELAHHWKVALDLGVSQGDLEAITKFDKTTIFNTQERAVSMRSINPTPCAKPPNGMGVRVVEMTSRQISRLASR